MNRWAKVAISVALAVSLCVFVWAYVDPERLIATLKSVSLPWFAVSVAAFLAYQFFRTLRFRLLVDTGGGVFALFNTQCMHAFMNGALPAGLGEVAFVWLLKKFHGVSYHAGAASLIMARFMDLVLFALLFVGLTALYWSSLPGPLALFTLIFIGLVAVAAIALRLLFQVREDIVDEEGSTHVIRKHLAVFAETLYQTVNKGTSLPLAVYSGIMWVCMYLFFLTTVYALGFSLSPGTVLFLFLFLFPINLLPIKGVANFGTHEAGWFIALQILGVGAKPAAVLAFGSHILFLAVLLLTASIPLVVFALGGAGKAAA